MPIPDKEYQGPNSKWEQFGTEVYEVKEAPMRPVRKKTVTDWDLKQRWQAYLDSLAELDTVLAEMFPGKAWGDIVEPSP